MEDHYEGNMNALPVRPPSRCGVMDVDGGRARVWKVWPPPLPFISWQPAPSSDNISGHCKCRFAVSKRNFLLSFFFF